jgi:hypothetical protein
VTLGFQKLPATLCVPFAALTGFVDPSVQFGLQFKNATAAQNVATAVKENPKAGESPAVAATPAPPDPAKPAEAPETSQVVSLDKFRKK